MRSAEGIFAVCGRACLPDGIQENWLLGVENGVIVCSAPADSGDARLFLNRAGNDILRLPDGLLAPAFVDIHCHAGGGIFAYEDPVSVMEYHRAAGTGAMLQSLYRDIGYAGMKRAVGLIGEAMRHDCGILGVHLEGPYLEPTLGSKTGGLILPDPSAYRALLDSGIIRTWTFAPELEGTDRFCREITARGTVAAIGHSAAGVGAVHRAAENGARLVTHLFNASGTSHGAGCWRGTKDVSFDGACMLEDSFWYEVICDEGGIHVRHDMIRLLEKTVGLTRIVGITDCFGGKQENTGDVNIQNGEIAGSRMTMRKVAENFLHMGYSLTEVFRLTAYQPACAIGMDATVGSLLTGRRANILLIDAALHSVEWICVVK